jgi:hypothetical protein
MVKDVVAWYQRMQVINLPERANACASDARGAVLLFCRRQLAESSSARNQYRRCCNLTLRDGLIADLRPGRMARITSVPLT